MPDKIAVIIPANDEEAIIHRVIKPLRMWRQVDWHNRPIIVVDDGSIDRTALVSKTQWTETIPSSPLGKRLGKADAFIAGVTHAVKKYHPDFIVTLDSDLIKFEPKLVDELLHELKSTRANMVVGHSLEASGHHGWVHAAESSGQRAFRASALAPILNSNPKWMGILRGAEYGLEEALNTLIPRKIFSDVKFYAEPPLRKPGGKQQNLHRWAVQVKIMERKKRAEQKMRERKRLRAQKRPKV